MKMVSLFSGGKDSLFATYLAIKEGYEVVCLLSLESKREDSYMFHVPNVNKTSYQAEAMGIPLVKRQVEGKKEDEVEELDKIISRLVKEKGIEGIVTGAIESNYQRERVQKIADRYGLFHYAPLWKIDTDSYMESLIKEGFSVIIVSVSALGLDESFLGKKIDREILEKLRVLNKNYGVHIAGEGGEYETFVTDGPILKKKLIIEKSRIIKERSSGVLVIESLTFGEKS